MWFSFRGVLEALDTVDTHERMMAPGAKFRWTVTATQSSSDGRLHVVAHAPEPTESTGGGVIVIPELSLSGGQTAEGTFVVPRVHSRSGYEVEFSRVVFRFSRLIADHRAGYSFKATRLDD
jgi:hypothetical protein